MYPNLFKNLIADALSEDLGMGDLTTDSIFGNHEQSGGTFIAKADGTLAGLDAMAIAYDLYGAKAEVQLLKNDGDQVAAGDEIAIVNGPVRALLSAERVILNLIQHLGGIATQTRKVIELLGDDSILITDTRKTLPGLRGVQKYAVTCGGGSNHRFRLDDAVMIKDNHIKAAGDIQRAVELVRAKTGHMVKVEVETENREQVLDAVAAKADVIMLDNRSPEEVKELSALIPEHIVVEVSGGITPENIHSYTGCGADVISLGWLTHSVKALDISFNLKN